MTNQLECSKCAAGPGFKDGLSVGARVGVDPRRAAAAVEERMHRVARLSVLIEHPVTVVRPFVNKHFPCV